MEWYWWVILLLMHALSKGNKSCDCKHCKKCEKRVEEINPYD